MQIFCSDNQDIDKHSYLFDKKQGGALNDIGTYVLGFLLDLANSPIKKVESNIQIENGIEMNFFTKLLLIMELSQQVKGQSIRKKKDMRLLKGKKGKKGKFIFQCIIVSVNIQFV